MSLLEPLRVELLKAVTPVHDRKGIFFKTGPGDYAEHDQFIGVPVPKLRQLVKAYRALPLESVLCLLRSAINEERLLALLMLVERYQKGGIALKQMIFDLYQSHIQYVNNWNLVDASAHLIVGAHLHHGDKTRLLTWASSDTLWYRRAAIVSTWYFIRQNEYDWTIKLAENLLNDPHDLIHKAVGWMLREVGKRDETVLIQFLEQYANKMPRTMLRYAIEKFSVDRRKGYLVL
jgi:3-methyladenine DNA glycosylase AlkD